MQTVIVHHDDINLTWPCDAQVSGSMLFLGRHVDAATQDKQLNQLTEENNGSFQCS